MDSTYYVLLLQALAAERSADAGAKVGRLSKALSSFASMMKRMAGKVKDLVKQAQSGLEEELLRTI